MNEQELREGLAKAIDDALNRCECCDCSAEYKAAADAAIAYIRQHDDWRPIETAPKDGTPILADVNGMLFKVRSVRHYVKLHHEEGGPTYRDGWVAELPGQLYPCEPSCWKPVPAPPKE